MPTETAESVDAYIRRRLDAAVANHTSYATFDAWMAACNAGSHYRPTIRADLIGEDDAALLADAYDAAQARAGDPRRAYRSRAGGF